MRLTAKYAEYAKKTARENDRGSLFSRIQRISRLKILLFFLHEDLVRAPRSSPAVLGPAAWKARQVRG